MSFLLKNTISIRRPKPMDGVGLQPYSGLDPANEEIIAANMPARVQMDRQGTAPDARLPGDAAGQSIWKILFKGPRGLAQTHDILVDELGNRYQVIAAVWGQFVTTCRCQILQS